MADPIKAMEMMSQLSLGGGDEPPAKARSKANDKEANPETAKKFESALEKARAEISSMAEKTRSEPKYTGKAYSDTGPRTGPTSGGFGGNSGAAELKSITNPRAMKAGGKVKSASARADGCCIRGKTRA